MTLIEAMKQALEALEMLARYENPETKIQVRKPKDGGPIVTMCPHKVATNAADVLRTAIAEAEKAEPVAWCYTNMAGVFVIHWHKSAKLDADIQAAKEDPLAHKVTPLYTTPPAQTEPEFECPRCGHCCTQRQWVGLTDEQINQYDYQYRDILYDAEKMLRENNT